MLALLITHHDALYLTAKLGELALVLFVLWLLHRVDESKAHS